MRRSQRARIFVRYVNQPRLLGVMQDLLQCGRVFKRLPIAVELAIAVINGHHIPNPYPRRIRIRQIGNTICAHCHPGMRIIHDGNSLVGLVRKAAGGEVMRQPERMPCLMRGQLADALKHHLQRGIVRRVGWRLPFGVRRQQRFGDQIVLANVHRVGVRGQQVHAKRPRSPPRRLKRLIPPARTFHQRLANQRGRATIHVVLDRRHRHAPMRAARILLDEAMPQDELLIEWLAQRRIVVAIPYGEIPRTWREAPGREPGRRHLQKGLVLVHRHRPRVRRHVHYELALRPRHFFSRYEREFRLDLGVLRKSPSVVEGDRRARGIHPVIALPGTRQSLGHMMHIAQEELRRIHQHRSVRALRVHCEASQHRRGKRLRNGELSSRIVGAGAER